ncbi:MAG: serine/threonine protein kinase, partial [Myxococcus sp.]|nr:serine/threonine protein kinase [Myxococcus sp.]
MSDAAPPALPRRHLGRFELVHRLDIGGMAEIFLALERGLHGFERLVVIKRALPHLAEQPAFREMFLQEARWVARLNHPNIVQIYELGELDGTAFIAMEHVLGVSFRDLMRAAIQQARPFPLGVVVGLLAQACAGAHAAHELADPQGKPLGLVHRDISPHNLMVTAGGNVKLLDFGIAKATEL